MIGVAVIILVNVAFSYLVIHSSRFESKLTSSFFLMFVVNSAVAFAYVNIMSGAEDAISYLTIMFFAYILTLITVLYDKFKPYCVERFKIKY